MSTHIPERPDGLDRVLAETGGPLIDERLGRAPEDQAGAAAAADEAWPAYHLGADALRDEAPDAVAAAIPIGWRALVRRSGRLALVDVDLAGAEPVLRQVSYGAVAEGVGAARSVAARLDIVGQAGEASLEERLLSVPAAYFSGLWLHDPQDASRDVVVPLPPVPPGLEEGRPYSFTELTNSLAAMIVDTPP